MCCKGGEGDYRSNWVYLEIACTWVQVIAVDETSDAVVSAQDRVLRLLSKSCICIR